MHWTKKVHKGIGAFFPSTNKWTIAKKNNNANIFFTHYAEKTASYKNSESEYTDKHLYIATFYF